MNDYKSLKNNFVLAVLSSLVAGWLAASASWFVSQSWAAVAILGLAWTILLLAIAYVVRRRYLSLLQDYQDALRRNEGPDLKKGTFVRRMSDLEAQERIRAAKREIWSFQISGKEFTANSIDTYVGWLSEDRNRNLLIAFANPNNTGLLENIVKLSGLAKDSTEDHAYENLRTAIQTTLGRYTSLAKRFDGQVDVRVYDFSPPYSFHAVDPDDKIAGSGFVELYLPDLSSADRPCLLLPHAHAKYPLYKSQSLAWFEASTHARFEEEPDLTAS